MPGFPDCESCPYRDRPERCFALATGHRPLCGEPYRGLVAARTAGSTTPEVDPLAVAVDTCPLAEGCGCNGSTRLCRLAASPVPVTLDMCRRCMADWLASQPE